MKLVEILHPQNLESLSEKSANNFRKASIEEF